MITVQNLSFDYPGKRALDNLSFRIEDHTITALVGPNGAGKSTLLRCLAALETPTEGKILINGWDADRYPRKIHELASYLSDFYGLYDDLTVKQNLQFFAWTHHSPDKPTLSLHETIKRLQLESYQDVTAGKLSRGLRQRLAIAQSIIHQPRILFLDEPSAGLDPDARYELSKLLIQLQNEGMTIIVSSHILSELEDYSTHMLIMNQGKIVEHCALQSLVRLKDKLPHLCIEFTTTPTNYIERLKMIPNMSIASVQENTVLVTFNEAIPKKHELLKQLIALDLPVCGVHDPKGRRMQDVYLDATRNQDAKD